MGCVQGRRWLVAALPVATLLVAGPVAGQAPEKAPAHPASPEGSRGEGRVVKEEPVVPLDKKVQRLRAERSGQLEAVHLEDPGAQIAPAPQLTPPVEIEVPAPEPSVDRPESVPELAAAEKQRWFRTAPWRARFADLRRCPGEVAIRRSVRIGAVPAGPVLLRWTTDGQGRVRDAAVVAAGQPVDPDVMTCVHARMERWELTPPATPFRVQWTLTLRARR